MVSEILFVNDNPDTMETLVKLLAGAGHGVSTAFDGSEALALLRKRSFDLVLSDLHMPEIDGIRLARIIRAGVYPTASDVPFILVSATVNESLSADLLEEHTVDEFIHLPCDPDFLLQRVAHHLGLAQEPEPPPAPRPDLRTILLVDDEPDFLGLLTQALDGQGYKLIKALDGSQALEVLGRERVSLVLLDYMLPDTNGVVLLRQIREIQPETLVVMLTGHGSQEVAVEALWAGAADYLEKPVQNKILRKTIADVLVRGHTLQMAGYLKAQIRLLRERNDKIERLKRINEAMVGSLPDPICVLDADKQFLAANPEFWSAFGIAPEPGQRRTLASVLPHPWLDSALTQVIRENRPVAGLELEHGRGDGFLRSYRARIIPLLGNPGPSGESDGSALLHFQDITEERRAARMEERLRSEQEQTRMMSTFVQMLSGAAHELNNPLAVIMGLSDLGRATLPGGNGGNGGNGQQNTDMFQRIFEQSRRCQKIVKDLTAFLATERMQLRPGNVFDVLEAAVATKREALEARQVRIAMPARSPMPSTSMNEPQIRTVFEHVLENACQAFGEAGRGGEIRISLGVEPAEPSDLVSVEIANDGPAIPEENLQRIFLPFVTSRNVGQGTGMGLAVCYGILRNHGGKIRARNLPDGGCAFTVWLPVASQVPLMA